MTRLLSGVVLAAAAIAAILFLPFLALRALACVVAATAADEYVRITSTPRCVTRGLVIAAVVYTCWWAAVPAPVSIAIVTIAIVVWLAIEVVRQGHAVQEAAAHLLAPMYIGAPLGMLVALHARAGWRATLLLIGTVVVSDSAQYDSGRAVGRRPLAPAISPKKTIEGAIGGVVCGTLFMIVALGFVFPATPMVVRVLLGTVTGILGIVGDLFESRLKRMANIKDSAALIPGHGGVLDRIDALLFAIPVFYMCVLRGYVGP